MVDIERGDFVAECVTIEAKEVRAGWEGQVEEGEGETCLSEGGAGENTVKTPLHLFVLLHTVVKIVQGNHDIDFFDSSGTV